MLGRNISFMLNGKQLHLPDWEHPIDFPAKGDTIIFNTPDDGMFESTVLKRSWLNKDHVVVVLDDAIPFDSFTN